MDLPVSLEALQEELQRALPEYSYEIKKLLFAKFIMAKESGFRGAQISITKKNVTVAYGIPSVWGNALVANLGLLGVLVTRVFVKDATAPRNSIFEYLTTQYASVKKV
jgi:hypothetical protein